MHVVPEFKDEHFYLSNFFEAPVIFSMDGEGVTFNTNEAAFQAAKFHAMNNPDKETRQNYVHQVANAPTPSKAKYAGRAVDIDLDVWHSMRDQVMREVVFQKFLQHPGLRERLVSTTCSMLVEGNAWGDKYFGRCEGKGYNKLGVILMEVRGYWLWQARRNKGEMGS